MAQLPTDFWSALERVKPGTKPRDEGSPLAPKDEGQLAVDVAQTDVEIIVTSTIAGAKPDEIEVVVSGDLLTIRGKRERELDLKDEDYFYRECYWGTFSRTIVLPADVLTDEARATYKNGVLTVRIPKESPKKKVPIEVEEE